MTTVADVYEDLQTAEVELNKSREEHSTSVVAIGERTATPGLKNPKAVRIRSLSNLETVKAIIVSDTTGCCW